MGKVTQKSEIIIVCVLNKCLHVNSLKSDNTICIPINIKINRVLYPWSPLFYYNNSFDVCIIDEIEHQKKTV